MIPYGEADAPFFFGREKETRLIIANLFASPLTLLYGASGVGKSSVLRAGVAHQLRERDDLLVVVFNAWLTNPVSDLKQAIADWADLADHASWRNAVQLLPQDRSASLAEFLAICSAHLNRRLMIILDQFEEYFLYHPQDDTFAAEFPRAVKQLDAPVSFLISIREDFYAKLDRFEGRIPILYDNYLRIEHLDHNAARAAIEKPIAEYNRVAVNGKQFRIEPELVESILKQVETGRVVLGEAGRGVVEAAKLSEKTKARIETPFLQLVMTRVWDEELRAGSQSLRQQTLDQLGGAENIVRTHLDAVMSRLPWSQRNAATRVFHYLVTPSGNKIAHSARDLASYSGVSLRKVEPLLRRLASSDIRLLRSVETGKGSDEDNKYEIFHDVLGAAIIDWRLRYRRNYRSRMLAVLIGFVLGLLFVLVVPSFFRRTGYAALAGTGDNSTSREIAFKDVPETWSIATDQANFQASLSYDERKALIGSDVEIIVEVITDGRINVSHVECLPDESALTLIKIQPMAIESSLEGQLRKEVYHYQARISQQAQPRSYPIEVAFHYEPRGLVRRSFYLNVGLTGQNHGAIRLQTFDNVTAGQESDVVLRIRNDFPDYSLNIQKLNVRSSPRELVGAADLFLDTSLSPGEESEVLLRVKVAPPTLNQLVFGKETKLFLRVTGKDGYGRLIVADTETDIKVSPNLAVMLLGTLAGGLIGIGAHFGFQRLSIEFPHRRRVKTALRRRFRNQ